MAAALQGSFVPTRGPVFPSVHDEPDLDEFHELPAPINVIVKLLEAKGEEAVHGFFVDRVTGDGSLPECKPTPSIHEQYPLECHMTRRVGGGWTQKILLARFGVRVGSGHHSASCKSDTWPIGLPQDYRCLHYKWRASLVERLRWGLQNSGSIETRWGQEATSYIQYIGEKQRIPIDDYALGCKMIGASRPIIYPRTDR